MFDGFVFQNGQRNGHAYAVVGSQGGAFGTQPFAVNLGLDRVFVEVELRIVVFLANHVHVALENNGRHFLLARCGRLRNQHVASFIAFGVKAKFVAGFQ